MTRRKRYSAEFKREALRRANEEGVTDSLVAEELGFSTRQLRRWRDGKAKRDQEKGDRTEKRGRTEYLKFGSTPYFPFEYLDR